MTNMSPCISVHDTFLEAKNGQQEISQVVHVLETVCLILKQPTFKART